MLMWGDRLLDAETTGYSRWEASDNDTAGAVDLIPKDIVICDWHYGKRESYPSIAHFTGKGFRVWPAGWHDPEATRALMQAARADQSGRVLGFLVTTWGKVQIPNLPDYAPLQQLR